jgi:nucleoside-diphosphate-sugar epimerase
MRYYLTGATGFIGGRVARRLLERGHEVHALVRSEASGAALRALGIATHVGDLTDKRSLLRGMRNADGVFHMAAWYRLGSAGRSTAERVNVGGTRNVLEAMRELAIPRGVYTSTLAIYGDTRGRLVDEQQRPGGPHLSDYDHTKYRAHHDVALPMMGQGLPLVIVMPGLVYGPGDTSAMRATLIQYLRRRLPMLPRNTTYCWGHVDDTADAHVRAMERGRTGESYIIAGPVHTFVEAFEMAERITGIPAPRGRVAPGVLRLAAAMMGVVDAVRPVVGSYSPEAQRPVAGTTYIGSSAKARRELGFAPRALDEGLRETLHHEMRELGLIARAD